ncbi:MAG: translocation/assembly module TamB domain-containing protein [Steroidobacter sp.]
MRKRLFIAAVLALLLLPVALFVALFYTQTGAELAARRLSRLERIGITIEGVSGTLSGPLYIERFELNHPRVHIVSHDIVIDPQLRGLFLQTIRTRSVRARDTLVEVRAADMPPSDRRPRFLPPFMRVDARGVELNQVRYVHLNGTRVDADRIRGRATVTSGRLRVRSFQVDARQFDATGDLLLLAGKPLGMQGGAAGHVRLPRAEIALNAQVDGNIDRLVIKGGMQQPSRAAVDAVFTRPDGRWRLDGKLNSAAFSLAAFLERPPFSLRDVALDVTANAEEVQAAGNLGVPGFSDNDLTVDARGRFANRVLHIASADFALNETPAKVHAAGTVAFDGDAPTLDLAVRWQSLQWPLTNEAIVQSAVGAGTLRGPLPYDFALDAQIVGRNIPAAQGAASGVLSRERITIAKYDIDAFGGSLTGAGSLQFTQPRAWTLSATASDVNPVTLHAEFPGRLAFNASAEGADVQKNANFTLDVANVAGVLRGERVSGAGRVQKDRKGWSARKVNLQFGEAQLALDGSLRDTVDARWSLRAPSLEQLLPQAAGSIDFSGTASGPRKAPHVIANLQGRNLRYREWLASQLTIDGDIDIAGTGPSRLFVHGARLGRGEPLLGELRITGEGVATDHRIGVEATGFAPDAREPPPRAVMQVAGSYEKELWNAVVTTTRLTRGDDAQRRLEIVEPAQIVASREHARLENLCLIVSAGRICAEGDWRRGGAWQGTLAGYEIPLAFVLPPSGAEAEYAGRIEGRIRANGAAGRPWQGDAGMRIIDAAIIYRPPGAEPQTLNLGNGGLAATATAERINFSFGVQAFSDTFMYANAQLLRRNSNDVLNMPLTGDLRARAADANILPLMFPEIDHAAGLLTANAAFTGSLAAPEVSGRVELANGELDSYRVNFALRDLGLIADLASNGLDFRGSGRAGDGRLDMEGQFTWRGGESRGGLSLRGQNLLVADLPEYRVIASPDLRFQIDGERMNVAGDVTIPSALIQPDELVGAVRVSDDARYVGEHTAEREGRLTVHSEVRITMGEDVRVDAFGLQGRITGGVGTTIHTGETPIGRGHLGVDEGRYEAYGQKLEISRGQLLFEASPLDDPGLDIEARRRIETTTVGINVRGTLQEPRLTFFSDPSMSQTQIVSYLLTGKAMDSVQTSDAEAVNSARDTLALQGGGLLASQLGRRLGLDEVGVESSIDSAGESNPALVLGKFLSPRLFISYGISLTEAINTLKLRYTLSDRWILKTEAGEHQSADVEFTIER